MAVEGAESPALAARSHVTLTGNIRLVGYPTNWYSLVLKLSLDPNFAVFGSFGLEKQESSPLQRTVQRDLVFGF